MRETIELGRATIEVEQRAGYLYMVEHGQCSTVEEVRAYIGAMELLAERTRVTLALIDARATEGHEPVRAARDMMWSWLVSGVGFRQVAFVLSNEMTVARVNMQALSSRAPLRAFGSVQEAQRWLTGRARTASQAFVVSSTSPPPTSSRSSSPPPAPSRERSSVPPARSSQSTGRFAAIIDAALPSAPHASAARAPVPTSGVPTPRSGELRRSEIIPTFSDDSGSGTETKDGGGRK